MSWHLVDGVPLPDPVAGHPALDFCNTRAGWGGPAPKEYLTGYRELALWAREAGLLGPGSVAAALAAPPGTGVATSRGPGPATGTGTRSGSGNRPGAGPDPVLAEALALREALYGAALGTAGPGCWRLLSGWAARARTASRLVPGSGGEPARWQLTAPVAAGGERPGAEVPDRACTAAAQVDPRELPLLAVAAVAADFLTSPLATCVGACPGTGCGWLFADPRRRRRWCSMAVCGNRAKARRHAGRRSAPC